MNCTKCGNFVDSKFQFCDACGTKLEKPVVAPAQKASASHSAQANTIAYLDLMAWRPFRWLVAANYGRLTLTDAHLMHSMNKFWAYPAYSIIAKVFYFGLDLVSSIMLSKGTTELKALVTARIFKIDWIIWKGHILFLWSGGLPDIYLFSTEQVVEVEAFLNATNQAAASAKYFAGK